MLNNPVSLNQSERLKNTIETGNKGLIMNEAEKIKKELIAAGKFENIIGIAYDDSDNIENIAGSAFDEAPRKPIVNSRKEEDCSRL